MHLSYLILSSALSFQIFRKGLASSCCKSRIFDGRRAKVHFSLVLETLNVKHRKSGSQHRLVVVSNNRDYSLACFSHHPKYIVRDGIVETNNLWDVMGGVLGSRALRTFFLRSMLHWSSESTWALIESGTQISIYTQRQWVEQSRLQTNPNNLFWEKLVLPTCPVIRLPLW